LKKDSTGRYGVSFSQLTTFIFINFSGKTVVFQFDFVAASSPRQMAA